MSKDSLGSKVTVRVAGLAPFGRTWGPWMLLVPPAAPTWAGPGCWVGTGSSQDAVPAPVTSKPLSWKRGAHSLPETGLGCARGWKFPPSLSCPRLLSAGFLCLPLAFRALICWPVIWTNVDGQKQAGLSLPPLPFSPFFHLPHSALPVRTSREKDEQLTHKINTGLTVSDRD